MGVPPVTHGIECNDGIRRRVQQVDRDTGNTLFAIVVQAVMVGVQPDGVAERSGAHAGGSALNQSRFDVVIGLTRGQGDLRGDAGGLVGAAVDRRVASDAFGREAVTCGADEFDFVNTGRQSGETVKAAGIRRGGRQHAGAGALGLAAEASWPCGGTGGTGERRREA